MMIEAFGIPVLLKAVEFLFEEGSKILQERRERRKEQQETQKVASRIDAQSTRKDNQKISVIQSKDIALNHKIDEFAWRNSEEEVKHLLSLLEIYTQNYYLAREQYAKWGSALVPPIVVNSLTEAEDEIANTIKKLQIVLGKVYGKEIAIPEALDDETTA